MDGMGSRPNALGVLVSNEKLVRGAVMLAASRSATGGADSGHRVSQVSHCLLGGSSRLWSGEWRYPRRPDRLRRHDRRGLIVRCCSGERNRRLSRRGFGVRADERGQARRFSPAGRARETISAGPGQRGAMGRCVSRRIPGRLH